MWLDAGSVALSAGEHALTLRAVPDTLRPGVTSGPFFIGPVALAQEPSGTLEQPVGDIAAATLHEVWTGSSSPVTATRRR